MNNNMWKVIMFLSFLVNLIVLVGVWLLYFETKDVKSEISGLRAIIEQPIEIECLDY